MGESAVPTKAAAKSSVFKPAAGAILQRKCACGQHTGAGGECEECRKKREEGGTRLAAGTLQRAAITAPAKPARASTGPTPRSTPAKPATAPTGTSAVPPRSASTPSGTSLVPPKTGTTQRPLTAIRKSSAMAPAIVTEVLRLPGIPLDQHTRSLMEARFGHDFSHVRVHTDSKAAESALAVHARAYTVGQHIVFGVGQYAPGTLQGQQLLAHELTHTIQQRGMLPPAGGEGLRVGSTDSALEHEADMTANNVAATNFVGAPLHVTRSPLIPTISRAAKKKEESAAEQKERDWKKLNKAINVGSGQIALRRQDRDARSVAFEIDVFNMPGIKGSDDVYKRYQDRAAAGALEATLNVEDNIKAGLYQERDNTDELRKSWLIKVGWQNLSAKQVDTAWGNAGGAKGDFPKVKKQTCQMDHIIELQLGGSNDPQNIQVLGPEQNGQSGREIREELASIGRILIRELQLDTVEEIVLHFRKVDRKGNSIACGGVRGQSKPGSAASCTEVECEAQFRAGKAEKAGEDTRSEEAQQGNYIPYDIVAGGAPSRLQALPAPGTTDLLNSVPENAASSRLIAGLVLTELKRPKKGRSANSKIGNIIEAEIDSDKSDDAKSKNRLPIELKEAKKKGAGALTFHILKEDSEGRGQLSLQNKGKVAFTYPYLSKGEFTPHYDQEKGFSFTGKLTPSIPLLNKATIDVKYENNIFSASAGLTAKQLQPPFKGFRITKGEVGLQLSPEFAATGEVGFEVGPEKKPILDGALKAKADENGFVAQGDVYAHLPGIDEAKGNITYRKEGLSGDINVNFSQTKLKYIKGGTGHIGFAGSNISADGAIIIQLPRGKEATVSIQRGPQGNWIYRGSGEFDIPKLKPVKLDIEYDGEHLIARGSTGIVLQGLRGDLYVYYRDGRISGKGKLALERGRAKGFVEARLSDELNISGEGEIQYQLSENLIGTIGVVLHEDQSVRVKGALDFPKPIQIFKGFGDEYKLFDYGIQIPIFAVPLGPVSVGLVGTISGGMKANYGIGPGELRGVHVAAAFNPLEDKKDLELEAGATLVIPAHAGITIYIRGGIGVSAGIASVTGGLTAKGAAELRGGLEAPVKIQYIHSKFILDAEPKILAELVLKLGLDADITAEAGAFGFTVEKQWVWNLAAFEWGSGLQFGLTAPIHYASDEPFHAPSFNDIKFIKPDIDLMSVVPSLAKKARGGDE